MKLVDADSLREPEVMFHIDQQWSNMVRAIDMKTELRSTRFDLTDEERDRLEFIRRNKGERSVAAALRIMIREVSDAAGYATTPSDAPRRTRKR